MERSVGNHGGRRPGHHDRAGRSSQVARYSCSAMSTRPALHSASSMRAWSMRMWMRACRSTVTVLRALRMRSCRSCRLLNSCIVVQSRRRGRPLMVPSSVRLALFHPREFSRSRPGRWRSEGDCLHPRIRRTISGCGRRRPRGYGILGGFVHRSYAATGSRKPAVRPPGPSRRKTPSSGL